MSLAFTAPRDDLIRMVELPATECRIEPATDGGLGTLVGYAAVFNRETVIDSWEGKFREMIAPSFFTKTLAERADRVKVLFNHGFDPSIGDKPLGKPAVMESKRAGLWTETPLDNTSYNRDLSASLTSGALDGMSFRFSVTDEEWVDPEDPAQLPLRILRAGRLYEFGPVTFPAYEATTAGIRARQAYEVWRTAFPAGTAHPGIPANPAVAASGTAPVVVARSTKDVAQALQRARALAALETHP